jgi:hypothetical protein
MPQRLPTRSDDVTVYLVLNDNGKLGLAYVETDPAEADRESIIRNFLSGQYGNAVQVVAFNIPQRDGPGTCPRTSRARSCSEPSTQTKI